LSDNRRAGQSGNSRKRHGAARREAPRGEAATLGAPRRTYPRVAAVLLVTALAALCLCGCRADRADLTSLERLVSRNRPTFRGDPVSEEAKEKVRRVLNEHGQAVQDRVRAVEELGILYKQVALKYLEIDALKQEIAAIRLEGEAGSPFEDPEIAAAGVDEEGIYHEALAVGFIDRGVYREALVHLERATAIFPDNEILYYYSGLCSAKMGKAHVEPAESAERSDWYERAEADYRQALELEPEYADALYALSILLVYETGRPSEAITLLERLAAVETRNTDALFLLARAYYETGRYERAVSQYELIEELTTIREKTERARSNRERIMEEMRAGE